jgi:hypothetical protein
MRTKRTDDGRYLIESDDRSQSVTVSEPEFLSLGQLALELRDQLEPQKKGKFVPVALTPAEDVNLYLDAHHTQVVMQFVEPSGFETSYALAAETAQKMLDELAVKLGKIELAKRNRTTN